MSSNRRRSRELTQDEQELWAHVTRDIKARPAPRLDRDDPREKAAAVDEGALPRHQPSARVGGGHPHPRHRHSPALHAIDRRQTRQIAIGKTGIDARLDLHGMRQAEAHIALRNFLITAQARGCRTVLVITGKGGRRKATGGDEPVTAETGVLRRAVPRWLGEPEFARIVYACGPSDVRHGGDGALYVLLRRLRDAEA